MKEELLIFWKVWRDDSPASRYRHSNKAEAVREAERLSRCNPDQIFYVMKATAAVVSKAPAVKHFKMVNDDIPF
jgi:hypothetical protein